MKRQREDDGSVPIVEKERWTVFGLEHTAVVHAIQEEEHLPGTHSGNHIDSSSSKDNNNNNNISKRMSSENQTVVQNSTESAAYHTTLARHSTGVFNTQLDESLGQCAFFKILSDQLNEREDSCRRSGDDDVESALGLGYLRDVEGETAGGEKSQSICPDSTTGVTPEGFRRSNFEDHQQETVSNSSLTSLEEYRADEGENAGGIAEMAAVREEEVLMGTRMSITAKDNRANDQASISRHLLASLHESDDVVWMKRSDCNASEARPSPMKLTERDGYCNMKENRSKAKTDFVKSKDSRETWRQIHTDTENTAALTSLQAKRRISFTDHLPWFAKGVHTRTHIKLQRAKSQDCFLNESQRENMQNPRVPPDTADGKTASESDKNEHLTITSSTPDISSKKSTSYFKRLRALVSPKPSKPSSMDVSDTHLDSHKELNLKKAPQSKPTDAPTISVSSTESLSDDIAAANAREMLHNLVPLSETVNAKSKSSISESKPVEKEYLQPIATSKKGFASAGNINNPESSAINLFSSNEQDMLNGHANGLSQSLLGADNSRRLRTTSETNYSLLRPYMEDKHKDSSTVVFTRIPSIRHRHFHVRLWHHLQVTPDSDDLDDLHTLKDATSVNPLDTGDVIVTDILSNRLIVFDKGGSLKVTFAMEPGSEPYATCLTPHGDLAVTLKRQGCVSMWASSGEPISEFGQEYLSSPSDIQCDSRGRLLVADEDTGRVFVFDTEGNFLLDLHGEDKNKAKRSRNTTKSSPTHLPPSSFAKPRYVCLTEQGHFVISDSANHCVKIFDSSLNLIGQFGSYGRGDGQFRFPYGIASDEDGRLYVADHFNNRISLFTKDGNFLEHLATEQDHQITRPKSVAVKDGLMYVSYGDLRANKVAVFKIQGV